MEQASHSVLPQQGKKDVVAAAHFPHDVVVDALAAADMLFLYSFDSFSSLLSDEDGNEEED